MVLDGGRKIELGVSMSGYVFSDFLIFPSSYMRRRSNCLPLFGSCE